MLALCLMLLVMAHYAQNFVGIVDLGLHMTYDLCVTKNPLGNQKIQVAS